MTLNLRRLWNFFAITGRPDAPDVCGLPVTAELQRELSGSFAEQFEAFGIDRATHVDYDPSYKPDDDELLVIRDFALPESFPDLTTAIDLPRLTDDHIDTGNVRALVAVPQGATNNALLCFQAIDNRQLLKRQRVALFMSGEQFRREERSGLVIRDALTAVFKDGDLFFPSEPPVRRFLDLSSVFSEATDPQVRTFLRHKLFAVDDAEALIRISDKWTRRKIGAIEARGILRIIKPEHVVRAGREFGIRVSQRTVAGAKCLDVPPTKSEFKDFLRLLDQDFLKSSLTTDRFRVNSKKALKATTT